MFTLLNASAGSGKTQRITLEFLKLILPNPKEAGRVLAITFTNKAAGEMKDRLIASLAGLAAEPEKSKMLGDLQAAFPQWTTNDISIKAETALTYVLHHYSDISISTIDSFMQRIIRTFARDLKLPANYEITVGDDELNELIIATLIDNANLDAGITKVLKEIITLQIEDSNSPLNLANVLLPLIKHLTQEASMGIVENALQSGTPKMIASFNLLLRKTAEIAASIQKDLAEIETIVVQNNLTNDDFISKYKSTVYSWCGKLKNSLYANAPSATLMKVIESGEMLKLAQPNIEKRIQELVLKILDTIDRWKFGKLLIKRFPVVALMAEIWRFRETWKTENSVLPVSDFNRIIRQVLSKEPVPFIYLRAGSRYKTIMIDEFQDTSMMQWLNLLPLIHESLSAGHSTWVVGDPKQSIYRWRNGQVEIMLRLPEMYTGKEELNDSESVAELIQQGFGQEPMEMNYRSDKAVVEFNNSFYNHVKQSFNQLIEADTMDAEMRQRCLVFGDVYSQIDQKLIRSEQGYVECRFYNGKPKAIMTEWLNDIHQQILKCVDMGYSLRDIAILTRNNKIGVIISSYLMGLSEPIPVISRETLQFQTSTHCRLAMCIFRLFHCPSDDLNAAETKMLLDKVTANENSTHREWTHFLLDKGQKSRGKKLIDFLANQYSLLDSESLSFLPPSDQIDLIVQALELSDAGGFFLLFLREEITKQQEKIGFNPDKIWHWWLEKGKLTSVIIPDSGEAVNIMTTHSSKGLQFPVVMAPYFNIDDTVNISKNLFWHEVDENKWGIPYSVVNYSSTNPDPELHGLYQLEYTKSLMDTINLMYVTTTRAEEKLYLFSFVPVETEEKEKKKTEKSSADSESWLKEFCESEKLPFNKEEDDLCTRYWLGNSEAIRPRKSESKPCVFIDTFRVNPNKPLDSLRKNESRFDSAEYRQSARKGRVIHELLASIYEADKVDSTVDFYVTQGLIDAEHHEEYAGIIRNMIAQFPFAFPGRTFVLNERELASPDGKTHRPDRMVVDASNQWRIIDFKTGSEKAEHKKQVSDYANLLRDAGENVVSAHIIYIDTEGGNAWSVDV